MKVNFTKAVLDGLQAPPHPHRLVVCDLGQPGLRVRVTSANVKTFSVLYRWEGRQRRDGCGKWPTVSIKQARDKARQILASASLGKDPRRIETETVKGLAEKFDEHCRKNIKRHGKARSAIRIYILPSLGKRPIDAVTKRDIHKILDGIIAQGKRGAAREVLKTVHRMFSWAVNRDLIHKNPLAGIERDDLTSNTDAGRELSLEELKRVWAAAGHLGYPWGPLFRLTMLSGTRRTDWSEATWSEINGDGLTVSARRYKSKRDHLVPLSDAAQQIIASLPRQAGDYLFSTKEGHQPVKAWSHAKMRLDKASGVTGWRTHDLRVTVESRLAAMEYPKEVRDAVLGHAKEGLQKIYQKHDFAKQKREALDAIAAEVTS